MNEGTWWVDLVWRKRCEKLGWRRPLGLWLEFLHFRVLAPVQKGTSFAGLVGSTLGKAGPLGNTPPQRLNGHSLCFPSFFPHATRLTQDKQVPSGARGGHRGPIPWPGCGRLQRTQDSVGR